jgi:hypothetical protein
MILNVPAGMAGFSIVEYGPCRRPQNSHIAPVPKIDMSNTAERPSREGWRLRGEKIPELG